MSCVLCVARPARAGRGARCASGFVRRPSLLEMSALFIYYATGTGLAALAGITNTGTPGAKRKHAGRINSFAVMGSVILLGGPGDG